MNSAQRERYLAAARLLGPETFNQLVSSAGQVRSLGRLRYWQEELITKISDTTGDAPLGPDDFVGIFEKAELMPLPPPILNREAFLAQPDYWYYLGGASIPEQWIAEAWEKVEGFRKNVTYEFVWEASKNGDLWSLQSSLEFLAGILPLNRMIEVYEGVRDESPHREPEFRPTFQKVFGEWMSSFPTSLTQEQVVGKLSSHGIVREPLSDINGNNQHISLPVFENEIPF